MVENLRKLRIANGITQQQLAEIIGTSQQSINKYENHGVEPDIGMLIKIADFFHTSVDCLVGHTIPEETDTAVVPELEREEFRLVENYRRLSENEKASIRMVIKNYLEAKK